MDLSTEDLYAIEKMTISEAAAMIARRVPARRFYTRLSSESDRAA